MEHRRYFLCLFVLTDEEGRHRKPLAGGIDGVTEYDLVSELQLGTTGGWPADLG